MRLERSFEQLSTEEMSDLKSALRDWVTLRANKK